MRIVLDTNILISALIESRGPSALLLDAWLDEAFDLVTSTDQLSELKDVLGRPRIQARITAEEAEKLLELLTAEAFILQSVPRDIDLSLDPNDNLILSTAITGGAQLIVSGDKGHMVSLQEAHGIPIVTPREAVNRLRLSP